jgi:hypothetical protein
MRLPLPLPEPSPQDVLLAQGGDRAARDRVYKQCSRFRKRERERERILAAQQDEAQGGDDGASAEEQSDARDGAAALLDAGTQGAAALPDDARDAGDAGFEHDSGFNGGFDEDDNDVVEQVWAQRGVRGVRWRWLTCSLCCVRRAQSPLLARSLPLFLALSRPSLNSCEFFSFISYTERLRSLLVAPASLSLSSESLSQSPEYQAAHNLLVESHEEPVTYHTRSHIACETPWVALDVAIIVFELQMFAHAHKYPDKVSWHNGMLNISVKKINIYVCACVPECL